MADLQLARADLATFADIVGRPLTPWQARSLTLEARTTVIVAPRQSGKSRSLAVLALHGAFRLPGQRVLIVSAGEEAAKRLLGEVRSIAVGSPLLRGSVVDETAGLLTLSNGSEVRSVPASERQIRGWTVDLLLVDEAALVPDDVLVNAALPTTAARPGARVVLASSASRSEGSFYDHAMRGEAADEHVKTFRWSLTDCEWISPSVIAAARASMSELRFNAEYMGIFASGADTLFSRHVLDRATADFALPGLAGLQGPARVLAGVDWGLSLDRSACVCIARLWTPDREQVFGVVASERWPAGHPLAQVIEDIASSNAHYDTLSAEVNGLGGPLARLPDGYLWRAMAKRSAQSGGGDPPPKVLIVEEMFDGSSRTMAHDGRGQLVPYRRVRHSQGFATRRVAVTTTAASKAAAYSSLRLLIDSGRLLLPSSATELLRELLLLRVDLTPGGDERIEASSGHDDLADALMISTVPYRRRGESTYRVLLDELADPRRMLPPAPDPPNAGRLELTATGAGRQVPREPVLLSVRGSEMTGPPEDEGARSELVAAVLDRLTDNGGSE